MKITYNRTVVSVMLCDLLITIYKMQAFILFDYLILNFN